MADKTSIIAEQDLSRDIYEANSSYRQFYGQMNYAKQASELGSASSYNDAIADAYMTKQKQEGLIAQSDYGVQAKDALSSRLNQAVMGAYDSYRSKHAQAVNKVNQEVDSTVGTVAEDLRETGQELGSKYAQYQEGSFRWLEDLNQQGFLNQGGQFDTYDEYTMWKEQLKTDYTDYDTYLANYKAQYPKGVDAEGNSVTKLTRSQFESEAMGEGEWRAAWANQQVFKDVFNTDGTINEDRLKTAIFSELDADGNIKTDSAGNPIITSDLNVKGIEMLDKLNSMNSEEYGSYSAWLSENNKDLYQWSVQRAMLGNGTNAAAAMANMGADGMYSFMERFGGLSQQETEKLFGDFELTTERLHKVSGKGTVEKVSQQNMEELGKSTKVMSDLYQRLDIDNAVAVATLEDGSTMNIPMTAMITSQFAIATGIDYEEAAKLLETGEFSSVKTDLAEAKNLTQLMAGSLTVAGISAGVAITTTLSAAAATAIASTLSITLSGAAAFAGTSAGIGVSASAVPVIGWVVAGIALTAAAVAAGFAISETRKANKSGSRATNEQEGAIRDNFNQWSVQSASVAYEMRRKALGAN